MEISRYRNQKEIFRIRQWLFGFLAINIFFAHYVVPVYHADEDILFFGRWAMYSTGAKTKFNDITWDHRKTYLFRDHRLLARKSGINIFTLYHLLKGNDFKRIQRSFTEDVKDFCQCSELELHTLSGSIYEHMVLMKPLEVERRQSL